MMKADGFSAGGSKDWDTQEEIQNLRSMYSKHLWVRENQSQELPNDEVKSSKSAQPKPVLKLKMRIQNQRQHKASSSLHEGNDVKTLTKSEGGSGLEKVIAIMLQEKKYWLSRIQEDNSNMTHLLQVQIRVLY